MILQSIDVSYLEYDWFNRKHPYDNKFSISISCDWQFRPCNWSFYSLKNGKNIYYQYKIVVTDLFIEIYETFQFIDQSSKIDNLNPVEKYLFLLDLFIVGQELPMDFTKKCATKFKKYSMELSQLKTWTHQKGKFVGIDSDILNAMKRNITKDHCLIFFDKLGNQISRLNKEESISKYRNKIISMIELL
jgi:hypothetical protein